MVRVVAVKLTSEDQCTTLRSVHGAMKATKVVARLGVGFNYTA